jgi:putative two-component system response regulator
MSTTSGDRVDRGRVLVVEDDPDLAHLASFVLRDEGYDCVVARTFGEARAVVESSEIDVCLCDLHLGPDGSGLELARAIEGSGTALVIMSGSDDTTLAEQALRIGAYDYLLKPFRRTELLITVASAFHRRRLERESGALRRKLEQTVAARTLELAHSREETIHRLARAVEFRDSHTGLHVERMAAFCRMIALRLGLPPERCSLIRTASLLHDIGKLGLPDRILVKPGPLTTEERSEMEEHTTVGHRILGDSASELIRLAARIALTHHERYDGGGYPRRLSGEDIPLEGRIAAVCDVFDALTSSRPYRPSPFTHDEAVEVIRADRGKAFDPEVVEAFLGALDEVERIQARYAEPNGARSAA